MTTLILLTAVAVVTPARGAEVERINLAGVGRLPAFSHATLSRGGLIFVSGTLGTKPGSIDLVTGGVAAETTQILDNIEAILEVAGAGLEDLLRCTVYLTDLGTFQEMNSAWVPRFDGKPPARAAVGVADLVLGAGVEIECIGQRPESATFIGKSRPDAERCTDRPRSAAPSSRG